MNDITVTKGSTEWDVEYTADQAATVTKTMETGGTVLDRDIHIEVTVPTGTEGTPVATKGTVSGNAVSVTPSVTNTGGFISGTTLTGTPVSVTASELVSGTKSITASGTTDVTNYASASVAAGSATTPATNVTATPTISVSSVGLITASVSKTQSVTPTVSEGYVSSGTEGTITVSGSNTQQLTAKSAQTYTPTTSAQTIASGQYLTGAQTILGDANLVAANIAKDVTIFGVTGTHEGGGGGGLTLVGTDSVDVNTTSSTATLVKTLTFSYSDFGISQYAPTTILTIIKLRNGPIAGRYYGSIIYHQYGYDTQNNVSISTQLYLYTPNTATSWKVGGEASNRWGVYTACSFSSSNQTVSVGVYTKYSSSKTSAVNGTYDVDVYKVTIPSFGPAS